ncbi:MAG: hypothetical protein R3F53_04415 [Gammaproteobacteria bacterium]
MIPLLLVPGTLCDQRLWRYQIEDLSDIANCRVADVSQDDSLPGMAQRALADADTLNASRWQGFLWVRWSRSKFTGRHQSGFRIWLCWTALLTPI